MTRILSVTAAALLGTSVLAGVSLAQDNGDDGGIGADAGADVGVSIGGGNDGANADVDAGVGANVGVDIGDDGANADAGADVDADVGVDVGDDGSGDDNTSGDDGGNAGDDDGANADASADVDTDVTGSIDLSDEEQDFFDEMGSAADGFFTDETRTQVSSDAEIEGAFAALTLDQQQQLRAECDEDAISRDRSVLGANICPVIMEMEVE